MEKASWLAHEAKYNAIVLNGNIPRASDSFRLWSEGRQVPQVVNSETISNVKSLYHGHAAERTNSRRKGKTNKFGWLQVVDAIEELMVRGRGIVPVGVSKARSIH